jgi:hypothetical protein
MTKLSDSSAISRRLRRARREFEGPEDGRTSPLKIEANRRNALASTGPQTEAGKARVAQNARKHGLASPVELDPAAVKEIAALARSIAGPEADPARFALACEVAAAQIDLVRVRRARTDVFPEASAPSDKLARFVALDRYEQHARSRRKRAVRNFDGR